MIRKALALSAAAIAVGVIAYLTQRPHAAADGATAAGPAASAPPQVVALARAVRRDVPVVIEAAGSVVPVVTVDVRAQVSATVRKIAIKEGQFVRKGDVLFTFDDRTDRANLDKAREQLLRDQATLADAERQLQRAQDLLRQAFVSQSAVDTARTGADAARATVRADEAAVQSATAALSFDTLRASIAGRAGLIAVNEGSLVQPGGAALVTLSQIDPIAVSFNVPESQLGALLQGMKASVPVTVLPPDGPAARGGAAAEPLVGRLVFVDNQIDPGTGTIKAKAELANAGQRLWPGQYVTAQLRLRTLADAIVIPQAAVIQRGAERGVYVAGPDNLAQWRVVRLRYPFGESVVVDGVQADERVVVEGKQNLRPGGAVREAVRAASGAGSGGASGATSGAPSGSAPGAGSAR